jgi:hypothetical protein
MPGAFAGGTVVATTSGGGHATATAGGGGAGFGGAIFSYGGSVRMDGATITDNDATGGVNPNGGNGWGIGGGLHAHSSLMFVRNSIVAKNRSYSPLGDGHDFFSGPDVNSSWPNGAPMVGGAGSSGNNLIGCAGLHFWPRLPTDLIGTNCEVPLDPRLGPLVNNGGGTSTYALQANSQAVDRGGNDNAPAFDQRGAGFARIRNNTRDIGAYESRNPQPTAIFKQPLSQVVCGNAASLTVATIGETPLGYQWRRNGQPIVDGAPFAGTTTATLTINPAAPMLSGSYDVVVTGPSRAVTSAPATVSILARPVVTEEPADQAAPLGGNVVFSAAADGGAASIRWQKSTDGGATFADIPGATSATLTVAVTTADVYRALYRAVFTNSCAAETSRAARVTSGTTALVTTTNDAGPGSLRDAVATATAGATIAFDAALTGQTIALTSDPISIGATAALTIAGPGADRLAISGGGARRLFIIAQGAMASISGLTLQDGFSGGPTPTASFIESLYQGQGRGGAILNSGALTLSEVVVTNSVAHGGDGGDGHPGFNISASLGGGGGGGGAGGGVFNAATGVLLVVRSAIVNNHAIGGNGGNFSWVFSNDTGPGGAGGGFGGAILNDGGVVFVQTSTISGNHARGGLGGSRGANNVGLGVGGFGYRDTGTRASGFHAGQTFVGGGGAGQDIDITCGGGHGGFGGGGGGGASQCSNGGNGGFGGGEGAGKSSMGAGGFGSGGGTTVHGGDGAGMGGAIFTLGGTVTLEGVTIANNGNAGTGAGAAIGGGVFNHGGTVIVRSSIIAANVSSDANQGPDVYNYAPGGGSFASGGRNLIGCSSAVAFSASDQVGANCASPIDPRVEALANHGGPTPTHALKRDSPAIDAGTAAGTFVDQRGFPRVVGQGADTGAFELAALRPVLLQWHSPAPIMFGVALDAEQLNATADVAGSFVYTPASGSVLTAGTHQLSVTFTPADAETYLPATAVVTIDVLQASSIVTWPAPSPIDYGTPLSAAQLNAGADRAGAFAYAPGHGTVLAAGLHQLTVTFTPNDSNHATASMTVPIEVRRLKSTIEWPDPAPIVFGTPLSADQLNATANVPGTFVYSHAAGTILPAGDDRPLSVVFTPHDTANYLPASAIVTIDVAQAPSIVTWFAPAPIDFGTALSAAQLSATADRP